jgi:S1-C subfamily serine protease
MDIYGDTLYTVKVPGTSGEFAYTNSNTREMIDKSFSDAIESSFVDFFNLPIPSSVFSLANKSNESSKTTSISLATNSPKDLDQAMEAGVTIRDEKKQSHGSGLFISNNGYILTNYHVIANVENPQVILHSGKTYDCKIVSYDKVSDLAIVKIDANVPFAYKLPSNKNYKTGSEIMVIGTPKSIELGQSVSKGIISGIRENPKNSLTYIQTDASINGGNSGGAMINTSGELIGIIDYKLINGTEGISFAIPANTVLSMLGITYE